MIPATLITGFALGLLWGWLNDRIGRQSRDMREAATILDAASDRLHRAYADADVRTVLTQLYEGAR